MALSDLIRSGMATADKVMDSLQATVTHRAFASRDSYGKPAYAAGVPVKCLLTLAPRFLGPSVDGGSAIVADATLVIPRPIVLTQEDKFTLPSGESMRVLRSQALVDPDGAAYGVTVYVGR